MASPELATVIQILRSNPPLGGDTIEEMRASMDGLTANFARPEDVRYEPVDAGGAPGEWTTAPESESDRVAVYLHGGGYAIGSIQSHRPLVTQLARDARARVLSIDYRLGPEHPHPAAVEDACNAFRFAVDSGVAPERIAIAGDSAGGGLTGAALIALRDAGGDTPAAGVCISPWFDLTLSGDSMKTKGDADPLVSEDKLAVMAAAYVADGDPKAPTASPLFADLSGLPPMLLQVGTAETLLDDSTRFAERAKTAGVEVDLEIWDDMIHVWHAFGPLLPEAGEAITKIGSWLQTKIR
ncbi:MAG: alpha/beta hydrolase [Deltaproteobacteria bacterium]|nr:alpha/beta hydrolase [Deltaproteobacteria bacterium]MBW2448135.1 alpha/beta hydrolase [Deltaproteobacteria bacterium]